MASRDSSKLPQINFSGLSLASSGSEEWTTARSQVMRALSELTAFEIVYDTITPEIREAVFGKALKELFALPNEAKIRTNCPETPGHNNYSVVLGSDYEALTIPDFNVGRNFDKFVGLLMGEKGNPEFRDVVYTFMMLLMEVDQMVRKMIFEGFGVEKYFDKHLESYEHYMRFSHYGPPKTRDQPANSLAVHTDMAFSTVLCQHEEEGLEILTKDGSWITPSRNSLTFMVGDELSVSNCDFKLIL
ncbi:uncharacterized protein A4U43_C04F12100 [Asparagus officinalis]|uniref:Isopenicillin N synthase-like Fe(2+) 2OG dioxygenase domain-containing protein n=1 Tax=Asparagus officinalis TaxID=4686 RepID=A0A5P1F0Q2_ASPOF|nr:uncharacterized protein A4U43_C04F12100 [Asparagus officinalis]